jgi:hypothetical protein
LLKLAAFSPGDKAAIALLNVAFFKRKGVVVSVFVYRHHARALRLRF